MTTERKDGEVDVDIWLHVVSRNRADAAESLRDLAREVERGGCREGMNRTGTAVCEMRITEDHPDAE